MNPFDGLAKFFLGMLEQKTVQNWLKLIFEMVCSGLISFLGACGATMGSMALSKVAPALCWVCGASAGMGTAAVCMTVVFRRSPLTKGLLLVLPSAEAAKEIETDLQVIQK